MTISTGGRECAYVVLSRPTIVQHLESVCTHINHQITIMQFYCIIHQFHIATHLYMKYHSINALVWPSIKINLLQKSVPFIYDSNYGENCQQNGLKSLK